MTIEELKKRDGDAVIVYCEIEGLGEYVSAAAEVLEAGQWRFATERPQNPANLGDAVWRTGRVVDLPRNWTSAYEATGGAPIAAGGVTLLLALDEALLARLRHGAPAAAQLIAGISAGATTGIQFVGVAPAVGSTIHLVREAAFVEAVDTSSPPYTMTLTRGRLGTEAMAHGPGTQILLSPATMTGRRVRFFAQASSVEADRIQLGPDYLLKNWAHTGLGSHIELEVVSFDRVFARRAPAVVRQVRAGERLNRNTMTAPLGSFVEWPWGFSGWFLDDAWRVFYATQGGESVFELPRARIVGRDVTSPDQEVWLRRGRAEIARGDLLTQVLLALRDFRFHPGDVSTRATAGWRPTAHAIDLLLNLLTSSHDRRQDWISWNRWAAYGNWACLPPGYGYGVRATDIDVLSFLRVKRDFPDYVFPDFTWGLDRRKLFDVVNDFLRPLRALLVWGYVPEARRPLLRCVAPRAPTLSDTLRAIDGRSQLIGRENNGDWEPEIEVRNDPAASYARVTFILPGVDGEDDYRITKTDASLGTREGSDEIAELADAEVEVTLPYAGAYTESQRTMAHELAARLVMSRRAGSTLAKAAASHSLIDFSPGDYATLTLERLPDLSAGAFGWNGRLVQARRSDVQLRPPRVELELAVYDGRDRLGLIAPSAKVVSVSTDDTFWDVTVLENAHTVADEGTGLPTKDTAAFRVGQRVRLLSAIGTPVAGEGEVLGLTDDTITIDMGDIASAPVVGTVVVLVHWDADLAGADRLRESYFASPSTLRLPDGAEPFLYGD